MSAGTFRLVLRSCAVACIAAALPHIVLGVAAERLLDPALPPSLATLASLDSQNRFYGAAFLIYGVLLWRCARDPVGDAALLRALLWVFFAGGLARVVSIVLVGWPSPVVLALAGVELVLPPILLAWLARAVRRAHG